MQINPINKIYKTPQTYGLSHSQAGTVSQPETNSIRSITFSGTNLVQKTVSSKIAHEKTKLLSHLKNILATNIPIRTEEEKIFALIERAHTIIRMKKRRGEEIENEMRILSETNTLNPQQKMEAARCLMKELKQLDKIKLIDTTEPKPSDENYDYGLINGFKNAILDDNYDLESIYEEHYRGMKNLQTVEEFKEKYPSIRIPSNPQDILIKKIMETLDRNFYIKLDELFDTGNPDFISNTLTDYLENIFTKIAPLCGKSCEVLLCTLGQELAHSILETYEDLSISDDFESIPEVRRFKIPNITSADKEMLNIDYDSLVLTTLKQHYLEGKKLNQIVYTEGDKTISIPSIKAVEYRFEKQPEKIKRLINDAKKAARLQRDYQNFTQGELKSRLNYYFKTELGNDEDIFNTIIDFDSCKFTEEDRQYLIKFLDTLDKIQDKKITILEGIDFIQKNNIHPHGTVKLNEIEKKALEEKIKLEQERINKLHLLREEFGDAINSLYRYNLDSAIPYFSKFYPETLEEAAVKEAQDAIAMIRESVALEKPAKIKTTLMQRKTFKEYSENHNKSEAFQQALIYGKSFPEEEKELRGGQYLLNRELIDSYPDSMQFTQNKKVLKKIMDFFNTNKNLATIYLCKYEDYVLLNKKERQSVLNILRIFDVKNSNDRIILKHIIENDYVNCDTTLADVRNTLTVEATIASKAKKAILEKYRFPKCIDFYENFETALTNTAGDNGMSGIKKTGSNNNALDYKMELKIIGHTDRLFSSKNNYYFDIYSEKGLH